jgi:hypothetical protein
VNIKYADENTLEFLDYAGMSYMTLVVHNLNKTLIDNGIESSSARQAICGSFLFNFAYNQDAGWLIEGDEKLFPKVCFIERAKPIQDENLGAIEGINIPTEVSSWHEYAYGVVSQYFEDDDEQLSAIRYGSYDTEN